MDMNKKTMTKRAWKELQKKQRSLVSQGMNLGTRTFATEKHPTRQMQKARLQKSLAGAWD